MRDITMQISAGQWGDALRRQVTRSRPILLFSAVLFVAVMGVAGFMSKWLGQGIWYFTNDPATVTEHSWSLGIVSQFGILLWAAAVAVCALAGALLWSFSEQRPWALFAHASAALSMVYLLDDALILHESVLRDHLGIPELVSYGVYGALGLAYLLRFAWAIHQTDYVLLLASLALGGFSMAVDLVNPYLFLLEDGAKFLAVILWFAYYFQAMSVILRARLPAQTSRARSV